MPGAEISNLKGAFVSGALQIQDSQGNAIITINPSTGGVQLANAGGLTISTGILGPVTISSGALVGTTTISTTTLSATVTASTSGLISGVPISTSAMSVPTISSGTLSAPTISSGLTIDGQVNSTSAVGIALAVANVGKVMTTTTDGVVFTLPLGNASTLLAGGTFTVKNLAAAGTALVVLKSGATTSEQFFGAGTASGAGIYVLANTKLTAKQGDYVRVRSTGSTSWYIDDMVGTWAGAT